MTVKWKDLSKSYPEENILQNTHCVTLLDYSMLIIRCWLFEIHHPYSSRMLPHNQSTKRKLESNKQRRHCTVVFSNNSIVSILTHLGQGWRHARQSNPAPLQLVYMCEYVCVYIYIHIYKQHTFKTMYKK